MRRIVLLTAFLLTGAMTARADDGLLKWEGSWQFLTQSASCNGQINLTDNQRVRYYPKITTGDPQSSLSLFGPHETALIRITPQPDNGQFVGSSHKYDLFRIVGGEALEAVSGTAAQPLNNLSQTPVPPSAGNVVTASTTFVTLTGNMQNYLGVSGCSVTYRATLVRIDAED
jgi:hypothetical protein